MVIKYMQFVFDDDDFFQNTNPGSPLYYGTSNDSSSSGSSPAVSGCNGCLGGSSGPVIHVAAAQPSDAAGQRSSSPVEVQVQVQQSRSRRRNGNNNLLLRAIYQRLRFTAFSLVPFNSTHLPMSKYHPNNGGDSKSSQKSHDEQGTLTKQKDGNHWELKGKLVLFDDCRWAFSLEDLLRASTRVLPRSSRRRYNASLEDLLRASAEDPGEWSHWPTYKVSLEDSTTVVVKIVRYGNVTREHMELLGQIRHENVAPLRGYLISRGSTMVLYDYYSQGNVSSMMRGLRSSLDWEQRRKIVIGAVRGIAYIHKQNGGKLYHGNLTSSSVFINSQGYGCISDIYCDTSTVVELPYSYYNPNMVKSSQASDVYGLGLLMLELLFGYIPLTESTTGCMFLRSDCDQRNDIYKFEKGLPYRSCLRMLDLALSCVMNGPDHRPKIKQLVEEVENI